MSLGRSGWIGDIMWKLDSLQTVVPKVCSLCGHQMVLQPRQKLGGVPEGWTETWALPGCLQVEHRVLTLVGAGGCHSGDQGGQAAQLRVAMSTTGPAAQLSPLDAEVRHQGLHTCTQCVKLQKQEGGQVA